MKYPFLFLKFKLNSVFLLFFIAQVYLPLLVNPTYSQGSIEGVVYEEQTRQPLAKANIVLLGTRLGTATGLKGYFKLDNVPAGLYTIEISFIGFKTVQKEGVLVQNGETITLEIGLRETPIPLREIVVTPGHFSIMKDIPGSRQVLTRENLQSVSLFGGDVYRAMTRLPGVTGNDFSAKFAIRGGGTEEVLVLFDGLELYEPFHLKDLSRSDNLDESIQVTNNYHEQGC